MPRDLLPAVLKELEVLGARPKGMGDPDVSQFRAFLEERLPVRDDTRITFRLIQDHEFFRLVHASLMAAHWTRREQHAVACAIESLIDPTPIDPALPAIRHAEENLSWWERFVDPLVDVHERLEERWKVVRRERARVRAIER